MDVNQVKFGNYSTSNASIGGKKDEGKKGKDITEARQAEVQVKNVDAEQVYDAMKAVAAQNMAQVNFTAKKDIQFDEARIAGIEAMMAEFESGVNNIAAMIDEEIPGLSAATRNSLAARMYAQG